MGWGAAWKQVVILVSRNELAPRSRLASISTLVWDMRFGGGTGCDECLRKMSWSRRPSTVILPTSRKAKNRSRNRRGRSTRMQHGAPSLAVTEIAALVDDGCRALAR